MVAPDSYAAFPIRVVVGYDLVQLAACGVRSEVNNVKAAVNISELLSHPVMHGSRFPHVDVKNDEEQDSRRSVERKKICLINLGLIFIAWLSLDCAAWGFPGFLNFRLGSSENFAEAFLRAVNKLTIEVILHTNAGYWM